MSGNEDNNEQDPTELGHNQRDAETNVVLGAFIAILGIAVLAGTFVPETDVKAITVNAVAGGILLVIGISFFVIGSKAYKKLK